VRLVSALAATCIAAAVLVGGCGRDLSTIDTGTPTTTGLDETPDVLECAIATLPAEITEPIVIDDRYQIEPAAVDAQPAISADQALHTANFNVEHLPYTATLVTVTIPSTFRGPNDAPPPTDWDRRARTIDHVLMWLLVNVHDPEQIFVSGGAITDQETPPTKGDSCYFTKSATFIDATNGDGRESFIAN
jgi:hypothetical protein